MNPNRWDVIRCNGEIEARLGGRFVLHDKRTGLIRGAGATRQECRASADAYEAEEKASRKR